MTTTLKTLLAATDELLQPWKLQDYAPNGLQVEGKPEVRRIVTGVTASQALVDQAITVPSWYTMAISGKAKMPAFRA